MIQVSRSSLVQPSRPDHAQDHGALRYRLLAFLQFPRIFRMPFHDDLRFKSSRLDLLHDLLWTILFDADHVDPSALGDQIQAGTQKTVDDSSAVLASGC